MAHVAQAPHINATKFTSWSESCREFRRIEHALAWLSAHFEQQPSLAEAAAQVGLSEFHFQRRFARWVGLSPKQFVRHLSLERAKRSLERSRSVLDAAYDAGLSGPGRLHDLFVSIDAVTPGEYKRRGAGMHIGYGFHPSPFGECLLMRTERGVCALAFLHDGDRPRALEELSRGWENAQMHEDPDTTAELVARIFAPPAPQAANLRLLVRGTGFQIKVWQGLLRIPTGSITSYRALAAHLGVPNAARALGAALGANPVAYLIPCHRVIRSNGALGGYRWGAGRKLAMLSREAADAA